MAQIAKDKRSSAHAVGQNLDQLTLGAVEPPKPVTYDSYGFAVADDGRGRAGSGGIAQHGVRPQTYPQQFQQAQPVVFIFLNLFLLYLLKKK